MSDFVYDDNNVLVGHLVDDEVVPLPPAPTGDEYDDLWSECCAAVGRHPRLKGRSEFAPTIDKASGAIVKHSYKLGDEVARWIQEGDLRNPQQVNTTLTEFADHWDRFVRLGVIPSWKLDWGNFQYLRGLFGLSDGSPLPSKKEYLNEKAAYEARESERIRQANNARREENERMKGWEAEYDRQERLKSLVKRIAAKLYSFDKLDLDVEPMPPAYHDIQSKRKLFKIGATDEIKLRIERGMTDDEILEEMIMVTLDTLKAYGQSDIPPLEPGQTRRYFTDTELTKFLRHDWDAVLDTHDTVLMLGMDGLWVLDTAPKKSLTEAERDALDAHNAKASAA